DISLISDSFRKLIRTVATPWCGGQYFGADGALLKHQPLGRSIITIFVGSTHIRFPVFVFKQCVADVVLGWDFLSHYEASLTFADSSLILRSPLHDFFSTDICSSVSSCFLLSATSIPALSTVFLPFSHLPMSTESSFLVCPIVSRLHQFQIGIPYCI